MSAANRIEDYMLDLYRAEAAEQSAVFAQALKELDADPFNPKKITTATHAVHALRGAARLTGLAQPVPLALAMEGIFAAALAQQRNPTAGELAVLRRAADWLAQFSLLPAADLANPSDAILAGQAECLALLAGPAETPDAAPSVSDKNTPGPGSKAPQEVPVPVAPASEAQNAKPESSSTAPPPAAKLDFSLLDLYRSEADTQLAAMVKGMVELEGDLANPKKIEPVMRAAHSLKGAARIIGLDLVAQLTHTMEDALVAAQKGKLALNPAVIDAFLHTTDWLTQFSKLPQEQLATPSAAQLEIQAKCFADMQAVLQGKFVAKSSEPGAKSGGKGEGSGEQMAKASTPETRNSKLETASADGVVRISATSLSRLMGLAAETLVEARRLQPFRDKLLKLKQAQLQFVSRLEAATATHGENPGTPPPDFGPLRAAAQATLDALRTQVESFDNAARRSALLSGRLYQEVIASRMRPFADGAQGFPRLVRDICRTLGKQARLEIEGKQTPVDRDILEKLEAPLNHLLRNACDHGLESPVARRAAGKSETGVIRLEAHHRAGHLVVQVGDDGNGIAIPGLRRKIVEKGLTTEASAAAMDDEEILQFLFLPGFSTAEKVTEISGRGVGLDVVQTLVQEVGGSVRIYTTEGRGTIFTLQLPVTRSVLRVLLVEVGGEAYAFPLTRMHRALRVRRNKVHVIDGSRKIAVEDMDATLISAWVAFGLPPDNKPAADELAVIVLGRGLNLFALEVDRIFGEMDLVVRPLDPRLGKVPGISAAALGEDGEPILIADVDDLLVGLERLEAGGPLTPAPVEKDSARKRILVVDDSPTVRATEERILTDAGYEVEVAVDGADGWNAVRLGRFDLVVSDVDMPRMNGYEFVTRIRAEPRLQHLPVIMVSYKDREEDRAQGLASGANLYLTKSSFQDDTFLSAITTLLATPQ